MNEREWKRFKEIRMEREKNEIEHAEGISKAELLSRATEGFQQVQTEQLIETLVDHLFDKEKLSMITRNENPHAIAGTKLLQRKCEKYGLLKTADTYDYYLRSLQEAQIGFKGLSREELVEISKGIQFTPPETLADKMKLQEEK